jgi:hypothetical protein
MKQASNLQAQNLVNGQNTSFVTPEKKTKPKDYSPGKKASRKISDQQLA